MRTALAITAAAITLTGCGVNNALVKGTPEEIAAYSTPALCQGIKGGRRLERMTGGKVQQLSGSAANKGITELRKRKAFNEKDLGNIRNGSVQIGMSESALECAWDRPMDINRSVGSFGVHKQYVYGSPVVCGRYGCIGGTSAYVYVENGKVTSWSD